MNFTIDDSARVSLASTVSITAGMLADNATGITHKLNRAGVGVLASLTAGHSFGEVVERLAIESATPRAQVRDDVIRLLSQFDDYDLLVIEEPSVMGETWRERLAFLSDPLRPFTAAMGWVMRPGRRKQSTRYAATSAGVARAVSSAHAWVAIAALLAVIVLAVFIWVTEAVSPTAAGTAGHAGTMLIAAALYVLIALAHELGHLGMARALHIRVFYVVRRGHTVSVAHGPAAVTSQRLLGAAGPVAAAVVAGASAYVLHVLAGERIAFIAVSDATLAVGIGTLHLLNLGPWSADGRALWARSRESKGPHSEGPSWA